MPNRVSVLKLEETIKNYIQCTSNLNISQPNKHYLWIIPVSNIQQSSRVGGGVPPQLWVANGNLAIHLRPKAPQKGDQGAGGEILNSGDSKSEDLWWSMYQNKKVIHFLLT